MPMVTKREAARRDLVEHFSTWRLTHPALANVRKWRVKGFDNHLVFYEPGPDGGQRLVGFAGHG